MLLERVLASNRIAPTCVKVVLGSIQLSEIEGDRHLRIGQNAMIGPILKASSRDKTFGVPCAPDILKLGSNSLAVCPQSTKRESS